VCPVLNDDERQDHIVFRIPWLPGTEFAMYRFLVLFAVVLYGTLAVRHLKAHIPREQFPRSILVASL